jgi:hydrogenase maturation factor HypF (carbamoyltransferase family)
MTAMAKCPNCQSEVKNPDKTWKYGHFKVQAFSCKNCGTQFRDYSNKGEHCFTLKLERGKAFVKA